MLFRSIAVVKHEGQAETARALGVAHVVRVESANGAGNAADNAEEIAVGSESGDAVEQVRALTGGRGADIAIEAVALPETWEQAVAMVRNGGLVNFFGGPESGTSVRLDTNRIHYGDITMKATFHHTPAICRRAFALLASSRFHAELFITGHAQLGELKQAFADLLNRAGGGSRVKTAILPHSEPLLAALPVSAGEPTRALR